ncbi:MAG: hypothetical protein PVH61_39585 [Candidatus Aminicenantes bacterium]|jgi:hypothetical protein
MSHVTGFDVENIYPGGETVWVKAKGTSTGIDRGPSKEIESTSIVLWVVKDKKKVPYKDIKIKLPDLKIVWTVKNFSKISLTARRKIFSKTKIVMKLKNIDLLTHPTTINVQVGGN